MLSCTRSTDKLGAVQEAHCPVSTMHNHTIGPMHIAQLPKRSLSTMQQVLLNSAVLTVNCSRAVPVVVTVALHRSANNEF